jgi:hypothetical protein
MPTACSSSRSTPGSSRCAYHVTALAYDDTDWVRGNRDLLQESITWTVQLNLPEEESGKPDMAHGHHDYDHHDHGHAHHDWMV